MIADFGKTGRGSLCHFGNQGWTSRSAGPPSAADSLDAGEILLRADVCKTL
ncbi:hypothetical protein LMG28690_06628 [Paraburkholderia caffeinilytica]|nr:hypothetical protein LMG28690_06628 [Paraburkholderia caffeinilytica]